MEQGFSQPNSIVHKTIEHLVKSLDIPRYMERAINMEFDADVFLRVGGQEVVIGKRRIHLVAVGKASSRMFNWMCNKLEEGGASVETSIVVTSKDAPAPDGCMGSDVELIRAGHPLPDHKSVEAAERILDLARGLGEADALVLLLSGGGSALMEEAYPPLRLEDVIKTHKALLESGMNIYEMNTIRKHLSRVKGGRLAVAAYPALTVTLAASDVPGDDLSVIASGPTVPDPTTFKDALNLVDLYGVREKVPKSVIEFLKEGAEGRVPETPKPGDPHLARSHAFVVARPYDMLSSLANYFKSLGFEPIILTTSALGESREVAGFLSSIVMDALRGLSDIKPPVALLIGGETSVRVRGTGWGGRNTEIVAWLARYLDGVDCVSFVAMDTDGIDGNSPAAGAWGDGETWMRLLKEFRGEAFRMLAENNTYVLLNRLKQTIITGPTGSNLNSVIIVIIGCSE